MEFLNIHVGTLDSETFLDAEPVDRATWLMLVRYCIGQENSGLIRGAKAWSDRKWQQVCRVTLKEVQRQCKLWAVEGDDVKVEFYPVEKQAIVQAKREIGRDAVNKRWREERRKEEERRKANDTPPTATPTTPPTAIPNTIPNTIPIAIPIAIPTTDGITEGKGREWNGMEGNRGGGESAAPEVPGWVPEDAEVMAFAAAFTGQSEGLPGPIDPAFAVKWLAKMTGRREFPPQWKRNLVAEWRNHCLTGGSKERSSGKTGANKAEVSASVQAIQREGELKRLRRELEELEYLIASANGLADTSAEDDAADVLRKKIAELEAS